MDQKMLEVLWNEYWMQTLSSSPLLNNSEFISKSVQDVTYKLQKMESEHNKPGRGGNTKQDKQGSSGSKLSLIEKESSKMAIEMNHGMLVETLKEFMFT
mmetsp:Transcript_22456/g.21597  ORF Transcript_22456/g.21597 Transcript_22456/m.21597 type:complete len:99 (+) Transcript_22456:406-702(+)